MLGDNIREKLDEVTAVKIGNQKLISIDSIALFGLIGILATVGAILTHKFQSDESSYLSSFQPVNMEVLSMQRDETCANPTVQCVNGYTLELMLNCTYSPVMVAICGGDKDPVNYTLTLMDFKTWNYTTWKYFAVQEEFDLTGSNATSPAVIAPGFASTTNKADFSVIYPPDCQGWCSDTNWMFTLCVTVAGLCVGFSGLVFLYLYLGCILDRLNPAKKMARIANLLLMQGEEPPNLDRPTTASKSESIKPDLKEY